MTMVITLLALVGLFVLADRLDKRKPKKDLELDEDGRVIAAFKENKNGKYVRTHIASDDWEVTRPLVRSQPTWHNK